MPAALEQLAQGNIPTAKALLLPFADEALHVRTLTTLSQLAASEGDFDASVALLRRAEELDPADRKVWRLLARAFSTKGLHADEVHCRRRLAFADPAAPAQAFVDLIRAIHRASPRGTKLPATEIRLASKKLLTAPDLDNEARIKFAEALYVFEGMAKQARSHYAAASSPNSTERDVTAQWIRMVEWCARSGAPLNRLTEGGVPSHRPALGELNDVHVFPRLQWAPVVDDGRVALLGFMIQRVQLRSEDPYSPLLMNRGSNAELRMPVSVPDIETPALLIGGINQYYHNTVEFLSSLAVAETLEIGMDLPLVVNDDLGPFQREQLSLLGYGPQRLIPMRADAPARFRKLTVPSRLVLGGRWVDPLLPRWYRKRLVSPSAMSGGDRRLYLSRSGTTRRRITNEDALIAMLGQHGFEVVRPETLSVRDQIDLFAGTSHIVGAAGAAMTNMLYAAPGAQVITIYNSHFVSGGGDLYFDALAQACGHQFRSVHGVPVQARDGERLIDADIHVDIDSVRALIE
jgi:capsular polysaccharide biosynthesis protein